MSLQTLGIGKYISQSALAAVLQALSEADSLPTATSRSSVKRARERELSVSTPFGQLLTIHPTDAEVTEGPAYSKTGECALHQPCSSALARVPREPRVWKAYVYHVCVFSFLIFKPVEDMFLYR